MPVRALGGARHLLAQVLSQRLVASCVLLALSALLPSLCIMISRGAVASSADAVEALKRFKTKGHPLDPNIDEHVQAYKVVRKVMGRVDPKRVIAYWNKGKKKLEHGTECALKYWGVPKENFPEGLPEDIQSCEKMA